MAEDKFFLINRKIEQHWIWDSSEPYDKRSAWIDIIMSANWIDEEWKRNSKETILIKRGSFPTSELKLSTKWKWDRGKVRRFLKKLEDDKTIEKISTKNYIIIIVTNYNNYQFEPKNATTNTTTDRPTNTTTDATTESIDMTKVEGIDTTTNTTTDAHRTEHQTDHAINNINKLNNIYIVQSEEVWKLYPSKVGKSTAIKKIPKLIKEYGFEQIKNTITRYIEYVERRRSTDFKDLRYQNGSTFFNSGYVDYLDENYEEANNPKETHKPQEIKCPICSGKGVIRDQILKEWVDCPKCKGKGKILKEVEKVG